MARSVGIDRAQVVAAAAALADAHGLEGLTLAAVAGQLGVRLPSLYNHVDGLPGLRRELALLSARDLLAQMGRAAVGKSGDTAVLALASAYRAYVHAHPGCYAAIVRAPSPDDAEMNALSTQLLELLAAVLEPYALGEDGTIHAIRGLRSIIHGFASLEMAGGFGMALDPDESFRLLVQSYVAGLNKT